MKTEVIRVIPSGCFITYILKTEEGETGRTYSGQMYRNYQKWKGLKVGDWIDGLKWKSEEKKIFDADSLIVLIKR